MDPSGIEMFPTKGIEYLLVIAYLGVLVFFLRQIASSKARPVAASFAADRRRRPSRWFDVSESVYYHPGHSWALPEGGRRVRVGVDDFAQKLIGRTVGLSLPEVGASLEQGSKGCAFQVDGRTIDLLSPIEGRVVTRNESLLADPSAVNDDPYGEGWLYEVETSRLAPNLKNLLRGDMARAWMRTTEEALFRLMPREVGVVMQDGGLPVDGIARAIAPNEWEHVAEQFLLTR